MRDLNQAQEQAQRISQKYGFNEESPLYREYQQDMQAEASRIASLGISAVMTLCDSGDMDKVESEELEALIEICQVELRIREKNNG